MKLQITHDGMLEVQNAPPGSFFVFICVVSFLFTIVMASPALAQDKSNDILLVSVGESSDRYSDVAVHLQGLLAGADGFGGAQVEIVEDSRIESLADGFYDPNPEDQSLRDQVALGYRNVILIPTLNTTPNGTIEYTEFNGGPTDVYDEAPLDNKYFAPEVFYEGSTQFSKLILNAGSTPKIFLPSNADENVNDFGPVMDRVANGVGMELIPGAYAVESAGAISNAQEQYLYASSIFTQLTGLNAGTAGYSPAGISSGDAAALENTAEATVISHQATEHYNTSYETEGAVVYRNLDVTSEPFNDVVRYMYKGSSTHNWTRDALNKFIDSNPETERAFRKLGTRNGASYGTRYWHPDDLDPDDPENQIAKFSREPDEAAFMFVSGSWKGADAQDVIDLDQANMIPMVFDWIKSFAISPAVSGTASTLDALDYHSSVELYFNYTERGWKLIPLTIGMGRLNEAVPNFVASDDGLHASDPLIHMNAYMMLSSALGAQFPLPEITAADIHRGSYTTEEIHQAALIGHDLIKELAHLSETGDFVPDSDLLISTDELLEARVGEQYSYQLSATGGDAAHGWELISDTELPGDLSLSSEGLLSGTVMDDTGTWNLAFKVTDGTGAFRKVGLKLSVVATNLPGDADSDFDVDEDDYNAWKSGYGISNPAVTDGDFNDDGSVDAGDYTVWRDNFPGSLDATISEAVPEPAAGVIALLGASGLASRWKMGFGV